MAICVSRNMKGQTRCWTLTIFLAAVVLKGTLVTGTKSSGKTNLFELLLEALLNVTVQGNKTRNI